MSSSGSRMVWRCALGLLAAVSAGAVAVAQNAVTKPLQIYVVDTEGGKAALFVSPTGQSALVDSGNPGGRDTDRIMAAIADAGVTELNYLVSTHYHVDHVGGLPELAKRIRIATFVDHGPSVETREQVQGFQQAYAELYGKAAHLVVKPGDRIPITGLDWRVVTSAGQVLKTPLPGGGRVNPACAQFTPKEITTDPENGQSLGTVATFGRFRAIDLADLLWNNEHELMCPNDPIGPVDLYLVSHHGTDPSGSPLLVHAVQPRVAVMQNGTRKGAGAQAMATMRSSPGLEDIWQLHWSYGAGLEQNSAGVFIANVEGAATAALPPHTPAYWIKITARTDGSFTVANSRNGFSKTYAARPRAR